MSERVPWYRRLQNIPTHWLYVALAAAVAVPVFVRVRPPILVSNETRSVYDAIERLPPGRLVMVHSTWDAGTIGECEGQAHALFEHLLRRGVPFVVWTSNAASPPFYNRIIEDAARRYGRVYGRDWADFGLKATGVPLAFPVQAMARDFPGYMQADARGTPAREVPLMRGVTDAGSFGLAVSIGYNPTLEFVQFMQAVYGTPVAWGIAAINATTSYTYIDSRQVVGLLVGARGGAEYEMLVGAPGMGVRIITAQSFGHVLIIVLVVLANVGYLAERRAARHGTAQ